MTQFGFNLGVWEYVEERERENNFTSSVNLTWLQRADGLPYFMEY